MTLTAADKVSKARIGLLRTQPFFGTLAMQLHIVEDSSIDTMCTNGTELRYSPAFVASMTNAETLGVVAHEVLHCVFKHPYRLAGRNHKRFNVACDYIINQFVLDAGLVLPKGVIEPNPAWRDWSADAIYNALPEMPEDPNQPGNATPGIGDFSPAPPSSGTGENGTIDTMSESDWDIAVRQAETVAAKAGTMPGSLVTLLGQTRHSRTDWKTLLSTWIDSTRVTDYSWSKPNRRHIYRDLYLPGPRKENVGQFVFAIDTSGSVTPKMLSQFAGEAQEILDSVQPECIHVVYCDTRINGHLECHPGDAVSLEMLGGGGTAFGPVFRWIEDSLESGVLCDLKGLVYLTDLDCSDSVDEPSYPVLWVTPHSVRRAGPFGDTIRVEC